MDQNQAIEKARQFARLRYTGECENIVREHEQKRVQMRAEMSQRGLIMSGNMIHRNALIDASMVKEIMQSRLDATLEGYELHKVEIDDTMAINMCDDLTQQMNQLAFNCQCPRFGNTPFGTEDQYPRLVASNVGLSANLIKTQIDRRRLMKKNESQTTIYNVQGNNARINVNSTDHSANVVNLNSPDELFATMRRRIEADIAEGEERKQIVEALTALQAAHGKPTFLERYMTFIGAIGTHVHIISPFIPALTAMLGGK